MMDRIDTHVHLWDPARLRYDWLSSVPPLNRPFLPTDFLQATAASNVVRWVFVECGRHPSQNVQEVEWVTQLAKSEPRLAGIVAHLPVENGAASTSALETLAQFPLVRGVRRLLQDEIDPEFCLQPSFLAGVRALASYRFTFDLCIRHHQLPAVTELVRRCPEVLFILDHLGKPAIRERHFQPWANDLRRLSELPNTRCKISGLATVADPNAWRATDLLPYLDHAAQCFGPQRILYGGDWPVSTLATTYDRWAQVIDDWLAPLSLEDRRRFRMDNAIECYRL